MQPPRGAPHRCTQAVAWCGELGVHAITVYAFSIENFKRSADEVEALMSLCSEKLREMCAEVSPQCARLFQGTGRSGPGLTGHILINAWLAPLRIRIH